MFVDRPSLSQLAGNFLALASGREPSAASLRRSEHWQSQWHPILKHPLRLEPEAGPLSRDMPRGRILELSVKARIRTLLEPRVEKTAWISSGRTKGGVTKEGICGTGNRVAQLRSTFQNSPQPRTDNPWRTQTRGARHDERKKVTQSPHRQRREVLPGGLEPTTY
jgi:hypothetical protein